MRGVVGIEAVLIPFISEALGVGEPGLVPVPVALVGVEPEVVVVVPPLKVLVGHDHCGDGRVHVGAEHLRRDSGMVGHRGGLTDVVAQGGDDPFVVRSRFLGPGGCLQAVGQLVDGEPVGHLSQGLEESQDAFGHSALIVHRFLTDDRPLLGGGDVHGWKAGCARHIHSFAPHRGLRRTLRPVGSRRPQTARSRRTSAAAVVRSSERIGPVSDSGETDRNETVAARPFRRSRSSGGGGKYSSSTVTGMTSTPNSGASRSTTAWTRDSGADAPAVTPTVPDRSVGTSEASLTRTTRGQPKAMATFSKAMVFDEFGEPITTTASALPAMALRAAWRLVVAKP